MKSKKNLTRFTYESAAFEGWRLCISRAGTTFTRYFPDKKFGGGKKSLAAAEKTLAELKALHRRLETRGRQTDRHDRSRRRKNCSPTPFDRNTRVFWNSGKLRLSVGNFHA